MFLTAHRIHNGESWFPEGTVLEVSSDGFVCSIGDEQTRDTIIMEGILTPGFVNVHCHLELSHLKGVIPENTTLIPFLRSVPKYRYEFTEEQKKAARFAAHHQLLKNGVVALGDIANTTDSIDINSLGDLKIITFIEAIGFLEARAKMAFEIAIASYNKFKGISNENTFLNQFIAPHAPYSVSQELFKLINEHNLSGIVSIHNQESEEENNYYLDKTGCISEFLKTMGIDDSEFKPSGKSSLQTYAEYFSPDHSMIFVHNVCTSSEDIKFAEERFAKAHWCLCPNANYYISRKLPDIELIKANTKNICIGTDSLASNSRLSILSELQTIKNSFKNISWGELIKWGTLNGARALGLDNLIGSIEVGKRPGLINIKDLDQPNLASNLVRVI